MKYNLDVVIAEVCENYGYGNVSYSEVNIEANRTNGILTIEQDNDCVIITEDQAEQLYEHLKNIFGE